MIKTMRVPYTTTAADEVSGSVAVPVLWKTPYNDSNYSISYTLEVVSEALSVSPEQNYRPGAIANVGNAGFTAYIQTANSITEGDQLILHFLAMHD